MSTSVKITYGKHTRRVLLPATEPFTSLLLTLPMLFPLAKDQPIYLAYVDEDGDHIMLDTDEELIEAANVVKRFWVVHGADDAFFDTDKMPDLVLESASSFGESEPASLEDVCMEPLPPAVPAAADEPEATEQPPALTTEPVNEMQDQHTAPGTPVWSSIAVDARDIGTELHQAFVALHPSFHARLHDLHGNVRRRLDSDGRRLRAKVRSYGEKAGEACQSLMSLGFLPLFLGAILLPSKLLRILLVAVSVGALKNGAGWREYARGWRQRCRQGSGWGVHAVLPVMAACMVLPGPWWFWMGTFAWMYSRRHARGGCGFANRCHGHGCGSGPGPQYHQGAPGFHGRDPAQPGMHHGWYQPPPPPHPPPPPSPPFQERRRWWFY